MINRFALAMRCGLTKRDLERTLFGDALANLRYTFVMRRLVSVAFLVAAWAAPGCGGSESSGPRTNGSDPFDGATGGAAANPGMDTGIVGAGGNSSGGSSGGAGASGTGGASGGGGAGGSVSADSGAVGACMGDTCPAPNGGVTWLCQRRFMYGINYAWHHFAGDFGGISAWNQTGVLANTATHDAKLADMRAHGVSVVRWWVFPDFRGDGVVTDQQGAPTGLGGTALDDLAEALRLAEEHDLYLMLTLFSFDNFRPTRDEAGITIPSLSPVVRDASRRATLVDSVVRPFAEAAEASPERDRVIAWDIINEPEWAITGPSPYGDEAYDPDTDLDPVTHSEMEAFVSETAAALRQASRALITVGGAAMKWKNAWSRVDVDFYQYHMYGWVNDWWPYDQSPMDYGLNDRPVVFGEYPLGDLAPGIPYLLVTNTWYDIGYAGALGWQYLEGSAAQLDDVLAFTNESACEKTY